MLTLGYAKASAPSALKIAEASDGRIVAIRSDENIDINWGRRNSSTVQATNKRLARELFASHDVPAPRLFTSGEARDVVASGMTVIGRPDFHTRRQGFWLCRTEADIDRALRGRGRKRPATHFIEFIDLEREFRVHIFQGRSIRISEKLFDPDNPREYTTIKPTIERRRHIRDAAKAAVAALGLDFGCVDVMADEDQAFVLEVNVAPGLGGSMPKLWADTFINWKEAS